MLCLLGYIEKFNQNFFSRLILLFLGTILIFIIGTRYASVDYFGYLEVFNRTDFSKFGLPFFESTGRDLQTTGNEFVFASITSLFKLFNIEEVWWFTTIAAISISLKFWFYQKHSAYLWLTVFLFISFAFFKEVSQIRNMLALAFILFAMQFASERKPFKFISAVIVAFGMQAFALSMLPLYFIGLAAKHRVIYYGLFVLALVSGIFVALGIHLTRFFLFIHPAIGSKLAGYLHLGGYELGGLYYFLLLGVLIVFFVGMFFRQESKFYVFSSYAFIGFIGYVVFGDAGALGNRFLDTYFFGSIPIIAAQMIKEADRGLKPPLYLYWIMFGTVIYFSKMQSQFPYKNLLFM